MKWRQTLYIHNVSLVPFPAPRILVTISVLWFLLPWNSHCNPSSTVPFFIDGNVRACLLLPSWHHSPTSSHHYFSQPHAITASVWHPVKLVELFEHFMMDKSCIINLQPVHQINPVTVVGCCWKVLQSSWPLLALLWEISCKDNIFPDSPLYNTILHLFEYGTEIQRFEDANHNISSSISIHYCPWAWCSVFAIWCHLKDIVWELVECVGNEFVNCFVLLILVGARITMANVFSCHLHLGLHCNASCFQIKLNLLCVVSKIA